jgi:putative transcriptional regulator
VSYARDRQFVLKNWRVVLIPMLKLFHLSAGYGGLYRNIKNNKAKAIRILTLDKLCKILKCTPGDLLVYIEDAPIK